MELKLVVLAGAKEGTEIPLKKDKFVIGRAKEANLRAGSEAISRQHCVIRRRDAGWTVRDLGSRNGTYVNDVRIEAETPLVVGNELRVGPLRFRVAPIVAPAVVPPPHDIKRGKKPPVQNVADLAERTASKFDGSATEDDISGWLFGTSDPSTEAMMKETRTIRMEETRAISRPASKSPQPSPAEADDEEHDAAEAVSAQEDTNDAQASPEKSGWKWLKFGKGPAKKKAGKLPPRHTENSKDSREAAADILREMTRRR